MDKIKDYIKKYKVLLIIGGILLILAIILSTINIVGKEGGYSRSTKKVESPYSISESNMLIDLQETNIKVEREGKVLRVLSFNTEDLALFISEFYEIEKELNFKKDIFIQQGRDNFFSFTHSTGVFSLSLAEGLESPIQLDNQKGVKDFFDQYFGIEELIILDIDEKDSSTKYVGRYILKGIEVGSSYIDGNAFSIEVDSENRIKVLALLLITDKNIEKYQYMPIVPIEKLISNELYPKMIGSNTIEERFYYRPLPYEITGVYVRDIGLVSIFNDRKNGLILPTYVLEGDGQVENVGGEKFWSETKLFICAVDPSYLLNRVDPIQEEKKEEEGAPNLPPN